MKSLLCEDQNLRIQISLGKEVQDQFMEWCDRVEFHLSSAYVSSKTGLERDWVACGMAHPADPPKKILVMIYYEVLEPLLGSKITDVKKMICHFEFATALLHEMTVSAILESLFP